VSTIFLTNLGVVPILVGPLQVLLALLPAILLGLGSAVVALCNPRTFLLVLKLIWRLKFSILVGVAVVWGLAIGVRTMARRLGGGVSQAEVGASEWNSFRGGAQRTGAVAGTPSPVEGGINWRFSEAKTFHASPAIVGNRVYATSAEVGIFSTRGAIYCLDAESGAVVWKAAPEGFRATFSSPTVSGKYLITGEGLHQVKDGRITCLDVSRGGAVLWSYPTKSHVESSALIANGRAVIGAGDDGYYCFQLEPDAAGKPVLLWHLEGVKYPDAENAPVEFEGRVYLGLGLGGQAIVCVDGATGKEQWRVATPFPIFSPPAIANGKIYLGMGNGDFVNSAEDLISQKLMAEKAKGTLEAKITDLKNEWKTFGEVWAIDLRSHEVEWRFQTDQTVLGAIVASGDQILVSSRGGTVYSLGLDGKERGKWSAGAPLLSSLAVTETHVYATSESGRLFALDRGNLRPIWEMSLGGAGSLISSPAIGRGHLYVGTPESGLVCVGVPSGRGLKPAWMGHLGGNGRGGNPQHGEVEVGEVEGRGWQGGGGVPLVVAPAAGMEDRLFLPVSGGKRAGVVCVKAETLTEEWSVAGPLGVWTSPAGYGDWLGFVEGARGEVGRQLHMVEARSGERVWSTSVGRRAWGFVALSEVGVIGEGADDGLTRWDFEGKVVWKAEGHPPLVGPPALIGGMIVGSTAQPASLFLLDDSSGKRLWSVGVKAVPLTGPMVVGRSIFVGTATGISAYDLLDGKLLWESAVGRVESDLVEMEKGIAVVTAMGRLVLVEPTSGEVVWERVDGLPNLPVMPSRDALVYFTKKGLTRVDLRSKESAVILETETLGAIQTPMIFLGGSIWFGTEKGGMVGTGNFKK
jgi:outer membrane protein assembly factor BamB